MENEKNKNKQNNQEKTNQENLPDCCKPKPVTKDNKSKGLIQGLVYGTIPHIGCIAFVIGSILGVTLLMQIFKPLLMNRNFFYYLILISIGFATLSSYLYLRKNNSLSLSGLKNKKKYLTIMYASTIGINIFFFFVIFPFIANINNGVDAQSIGKFNTIKLKVDIPCPGHAPLISSELKTINGVKGVEFSYPNYFTVYYDSSITNTNKIISLEVFKEYPAKTIESIDRIESNTNADITGNSILNKDYQEINMNIDSSGYSPNSFILKKGIPVKWNINVEQLTGCNKELILKAYNLDKQLKQGLNTIEFTPDKTGNFQFTCGMGMLKGSFIVTETGTASQEQVKAATPISTGSCNMGANGGGCGCGM